MAAIPEGESKVSMHILKARLALLLGPSPPQVKNGVVDQMLVAVAVQAIVARQIGDDVMFYEIKG